MKSIGRQLVTTNSDRLSLTKIWSFIAYAVSTWIVIYMTIKDRMSAEILLIYMGTVGGVAQVSKWLSYKYSGGSGDTDVPKPEEQAIIAKCPDCQVPAKPARAEDKIPEGD